MYYQEGRAWRGSGGAARPDHGTAWRMTGNAKHPTRKPPKRCLTLLHVVIEVVSSAARVVFAHPLPSHHTSTQRSTPDVLLSRRLNHRAGVTSTCAPRGRESTRHFEIQHGGPAPRSDRWTMSSTVAMARDPPGRDSEDFPNGGKPVTQPGHRTLAQDCFISGPSHVSSLSSARPSALCLVPLSSRAAILLDTHAHSL